MTGTCLTVRSGRARVRVDQLDRRGAAPLRRRANGPDIIGVAIVGRPIAHGEGFVLSSVPIWVRPAAVALSLQTPIQEPSQSY